MKKNYKRLIKKNLGQRDRRSNQEKKGDKLYVKWKGYESSFNRWIDEKGLIK